MREDDIANGLEASQAEGPGGADLAGGDRLDRTPEVLRLIGSCVKPEGDPCGQDRGEHQPHIRKPKVKKKKLDQKRRSPDQFDVSRAGQMQRPPPVDPAQGQGPAEDEPRADADEGDLDRHPCSLKEVREEATCQGDEAPQRAHLLVGSRPRRSTNPGTQRRLSRRNRREFPSRVRRK